MTVKSFCVGMNHWYDCTTNDLRHTYVRASTSRDYESISHTHTHTSHRTGLPLWRYERPKWRQMLARGWRQGRSCQIRVSKNDDRHRNKERRGGGRRVARGAPSKVRAPHLPAWDSNRAHQAESRYIAVECRPRSRCCARTRQASPTDLAS